MSPAPKKWVSSFLGTCIELHINQSKTTWLCSPILKWSIFTFDEVLMLSCLVRKNCPQLSRLKLHHTGTRQQQTPAVPSPRTSHSHGAFMLSGRFWASSRDGGLQGETWHDESPFVELLCGYTSTSHLQGCHHASWWNRFVILENGQGVLKLNLLWFPATVRLCN